MAFDIAIVGDTLPYPATAGSRIRLLNLMLKLARKHRLTFFCRAAMDAPETKEGVRLLMDHGINPIVVPDPPTKKTGLPFYASLAANLFSSWPYAAWIHYSPILCETLRAHARKHPVDIWQIEWLTYANALRGIPNLRRIVVAHNVESLIWQRYVETETCPFKRLYLREQFRRFKNLEGQMLAEANRVVAVSPEDAALARSWFGLEQVDVVDNGIDKDYFGAVTGVRQPKSVLFLGSLEWRPNQDAIKLLLDDIWPAVLKEEPDARLAIVGRNPPAWLLKRAPEHPTVQIHANVPDVRPFLAQSSVMAVPLRIGGGSRLKILEALASGLPVVSTKIGAEGLVLTPGKDLVITENTDQMAAALIRALREPARMLEMAARGQTIVRERYDWAVLAEKLEDVWHRCLAG